MLVTHSVPEVFTASHNQALSAPSVSSCQMHLAPQLSVAPHRLSNYGQGFLSHIYIPFVLVQAAFQPYLQPWTPAESLPPNSEMPAVFSLSTSIRRSPNTTSRLSSKAESFQNFLHEFSPDSSSWIGFFNCYDSMQLCLCYCPHSTLR